MRIGQQSIIWFLSNVGASLLAFLATLYFARVLGASALGVYSMVIALAAWVKLPTTMGIGGAITKRVSEGKEQHQFKTAGGILLALLSALVSILLFAARALVNDYVGFPATKYLIGILLTGTALTYVQACLKGQHLVHVSGVLSPIEVSSRSAFQVGLVFATGLGIAGMLLGYVLGTFLVLSIGLYVLPGRLQFPDQHHFESLLSFAQFSWLASVRSKVFNWIDIVILGFFVSSSLVGVYSVSWTLASFLGLFSGAVRSSMFPQISEVSDKKSLDAVSNLVESSLSYTGLFLIPGFLGSLVVGDRILRIYGDEFSVGETVLILLIFAYLIHSYGKQMINVLNGVDRPELAFRVSLAYIIVNLVANIGLVYAYGWVGAAVATLVSATIGLTMSYYYLCGLLNFQIPFDFIGKQWASAGVMALAVFAIRIAIESNKLLVHNFLLVLILVSIGAGLYFSTLFAIAPRFRKTVRDNSPWKIPF